METAPKFPPAEYEKRPSMGRYEFHCAVRPFGTFLKWGPQSKNAARAIVRNTINSPRRMDSTFAAGRSGWHGVSEESAMFLQPRASNGGGTGGVSADAISAHLTIHRVYLSIRARECGRARNATYAEPA